MNIYHSVNRMNIQIGLLIFATYLARNIVNAKGKWSCKDAKGKLYEYDEVKVSKRSKNIVDNVLYKTGEIFQREILDPLPLDLPPYVLSIGPLGIGTFKMYDCKLYNVTTVLKSLQAEVQLIDSAINLNSTLGFKDMKIKCQYEAYTWIGPSVYGSIIIEASDITSDAEINLNLLTFKPQISYLKLHNNGSLNVYLEGGYIGTIMNTLAGTIANVFETLILNEAEKMVAEKLQKILESTFSFQTSKERNLLFGVDCVEVSSLSDSKFLPTEYENEYDYEYEGQYKDEYENQYEGEYENEYDYEYEGQYEDEYKDEYENQYEGEYKNQYEGENEDEHEEENGDGYEEETTEEAIYFYES